MGHQAQPEEQPPAQQAKVLQAQVCGALREANVLVVQGETGCGKSTQVPLVRVLGEN